MERCSGTRKPRAEGTRERIRSNLDNHSESEGRDGEWAAVEVVKELGVVGENGAGRPGGIAAEHGESRAGWKSPAATFPLTGFDWFRSSQ